jgi:hypothetical protein
MKDDALVALREAIAEDQFRKALKLATDASLQPILRGEGSSEVRRELLGKGTQVATSGSTRSLEQILRIAQLLAPVDDSSGTEFADAVLDRVCKLEDDSQEALGNPLVLSLVQDLTQTGLRPHPTKLLLVFDRLAVFERTPSPLFRERLYGLLLERVRNDQTLHISHLNDLNWETWRDRPELTATSDARETFLWLALECDVKAPERRKLAGEKMLELAAGEGSELGPVSRGRAMLFASQTWRGTPPKDVHLGLVSACKISPADPDLCRETAEAYMKLARDHAGKGSAMRDNLLRAFWFAAVGVNAIESLEYDRVASLAKSCFKVRRLLVVLCSALGNDAAAQKVIDSVAERPTGNTPHQLNTLETARREGSAEWRKRLDGEPQVGAKPTQKWTEVNEAVLRGHHRKRLKGLSKPERLEVVEANVLAARGANWDTVRPHIRRALKLSSNASAVRLEHLRLASAYAQYAAAESVHEGLLSVQDPSVQLEVRLLHAELLWFRSRLGDALREFSALAADDTAGVVGRIAEAESAWLRGEYLAARNAASKVVAIDRFNLSARLIKSMALLSARQRAPARAYFKLAFERVGVGDPRSRGVRTALRVLDGSKSLGPQRLVIHDGAKRALAAGPGDFDRRLAIQLALGSGTGFARRWAASTARTLSTDKSVSTSHSLLLVGFVNLVRNDSKSAAELWREALRQDPGLAIPRPYLERFAKRTSQAEADSFR